MVDIRPPTERCGHCGHQAADTAPYTVPSDPPQRIARCCFECRSKLATAWAQYHAGAGKPPDPGKPD